MLQRIIFYVVICAVIIYMSTMFIGLSLYHFFGVSPVLATKIGAIPGLVLSAIFIAKIVIAGVEDRKYKTIVSQIVKEDHKAPIITGTDYERLPSQQFYRLWQSMTLMERLRFKVA